MRCPEELASPAYIFHLDEFHRRCQQVKDLLGDIPLTYSMKANPFLLNQLPATISHVEVCSPGELAICRSMKIPADKIIYSGVMKEAWDIEEAIHYGVGIYTAESRRHVEMESQAAMKVNRQIPVLLRLTSGNQFGMEAEDILDILAHRDSYPGIRILGIHYYSGTSKSLRQIRKDFQRLEHLLGDMKVAYDYQPELVEYGPGIGVEYFSDSKTPDAMELEKLEEVAAYIHDLASRYPVGVEMGRFLASTCGHYLTRIMDRKQNHDTNYLILDGGIHQLKYYGQSMALQVPHLSICKEGEELNWEKLSRPASDFSHTGEPAFEAVQEAKGKLYTLCGSLCTTADILVREVTLPEVGVGDYMLFHRCGAYSVTEPGYLFLSRTMPRIWLYQSDSGYYMARDFRDSHELNLTGEDVWA